MTVTAVVPAYNNENTVGETVRTLLGNDRIDEVLVVDDGSTDATSERASHSNARVLRLNRNSGKHAALRTGMSHASGELLVMVDGDTGTSSSAVVGLLEPILSGQADMVVGVLPSAGTLGGFGLVRDFAAWCIRWTSGYRSRAPMSGQRALRKEVYEACGLRGYGYGVDARLTADAVLNGFRVVELEVDMTHDHKGRSFHGFAHRARQGWHIVRSFTPLLLRSKFRSQRAR